MKTGLALLKGRQLRDNINVSDLEKKYNFNLSPLYKIFVETFYLGEEHIYREKFYSEKFNDYFDCSTYIFMPNKDVGFIHFVDIEKAFEIYSFGGLSDLDYQKNFFPVGVSDGNGLYLGTVGNDIDKIFFDDTDGTPPKVIANNIFEFLRGIEVRELDEKFLVGNAKYSQLYKRWRENFWRFRKE